MEITFLGGADEVGASSILIEIAGRRLLIDAGIRPTPKARWGLAGDQLPDLSLIEQRGGLDAILVTHAHTDHTGALELVLERYPDVPVYATPVTVELTRVLHADARKIMQMRLEEEGELPLFDEVATTRLLQAFRPVALNQPLTLGSGLDRDLFPGGTHRRGRHDRPGQRRRPSAHLRRHLHRSPAYGGWRASARVLSRTCSSWRAPTADGSTPTVWPRSVAWWRR